MSDTSLACDEMVESFDIEDGPWRGTLDRTFELREKAFRCRDRAQIDRCHPIAEVAARSRNEFALATARWPAHHDPGDSLLQSVRAVSEEELEPSRQKLVLVVEAGREYRGCRSLRVLRRSGDVFASILGSTSKRGGCYDRGGGGRDLDDLYRAFVGSVAVARGHRYAEECPRHDIEHASLEAHADRGCVGYDSTLDGNGVSRGSGTVVEGTLWDLEFVETRHLGRGDTHMGLADLHDTAAGKPERREQGWIGLGRPRGSRSEYESHSASLSELGTLRNRGTDAIVTDPLPTGVGCRCWLGDLRVDDTAGGESELPIDVIDPGSGAVQPRPQQHRLIYVEHGWWLGPLDAGGVSRQRRSLARTPRRAETATFDDECDAVEGRCLDPSCRLKAVPHPRSVECPRKSRPSIAYGSGVLVAFEVCQAGHPILEPSSEDCRGPNTQHELIDDGGVLGRRDRSGARTHGAADLGEPASTARSRTASNARSVPEGCHHDLGCPTGTEGAKGQPGGAWCPRDREPREPLIGEANPVQGPRWFRSAVVQRCVLGDHPKLEHGCLDLSAGLEILDSVEITQHGVDPSPGVAAEIRPDSGAQVGRLPDVDRCAGRVAERVDAGPTRQAFSEAELADGSRPLDRRQGEEIVEVGYTDRPGPFEEGPEHVGGGQGIIKSTVIGCHR